jgi:CheY-like chemotaxis protein
MLQQISRYADLARQHKGEHNYVEMLGERVELASKTAQSLFDRVTSQILAGSASRANAASKVAQPTFTVMPAPTDAQRAAHSAPPAAPAPRPQPVIAPAAKLSAVPAPKTEPVRLAPIPPEIAVLNPNGHRELILLVDDETEISELASEMLTEEGYKVILAKDGIEALKIYQKIGPHIGLVVLDFFLPIMEGDAVFDELRALNPNVDVVLSSGFAEQSKLGAMLAQGLRGFIPKPYTREKLLAQVRSTLDAGRDAR